MSAKDRIAITLNGEWFRQSDLYALTPKKLAELLEALSSKQIEDIADINLRDYAGEGDNEYARLSEFVQHLNYLLRPFAIATKDDSMAECEKLFSIVYRNYVFQRRFIKDKGLKAEYDAYCDEWHTKDKL